jgi:hypothetical protein
MERAFTFNVQGLQPVVNLPAIASTKIEYFLTFRWPFVYTHGAFN